jgi:hypothetical protein
MRHWTLLLILLALPWGVFSQSNGLNLALANQLVKLPLKCADKAFPYKTGITFGDSGRLVAPQNYHPVFYGCFDWHSAVHGHWLMARLLKEYPGLAEKEKVWAVLNNHFTPEKLAQELALFKDPNNKSFERLYGWAWLFQLQNDLLTWPNSDAQRWAQALQPLVTQLRNYTLDFLDKLAYPIRAGEHANSAFGLRLIYDYGTTAKDTALTHKIDNAAIGFYGKDTQAPLHWEPSGYDFLSPTLEEAALMGRVLQPMAYAQWLKRFLPDLFTGRLVLPVAMVKDRTDGKLVHLDGLNLSRVWCLKEIQAFLKKAHALNGTMQQNINGLITAHQAAGLKSVASGDYAGEHWLASFALYALMQ